MAGGAHALEVVRIQWVRVLPPLGIERVHWVDRDLMVHRIGEDQLPVLLTHDAEGMHL